MRGLLFLSPERRRLRAVWSDPVRKLRTLESFANTEADGGRDIAAAARGASDPELRAHLTRHAADENRHAQMFHQRALALRDDVGTAALTRDEGERRFELGQERADLDQHGFLRAGLFDELGEVAYVAMLHVAERRAAQLFHTHRELTRDDPTTSAVFADILRDEKYHVAYTGTILDKWRKEGRATEVSAALASARGSRFLGAWKRAGARMGAHASRTLLVVLSFTLLSPVGWLASRTKATRGWIQRPKRGGASAISSQY
jgi:bacterioferritin (cytochrome b1)